MCSDSVSEHLGQMSEHVRQMSDHLGRDTDRSIRKVIMDPHPASEVWMISDQRAQAKQGLSADSTLFRSFYLPD